MADDKAIDEAQTGTRRRRRFRWGLELCLQEEISPNGVLSSVVGGDSPNGGVCTLSSSLAWHLQIPYKKLMSLGGVPKRGDEDEGNEEERNFEEGIGGVGNAPSDEERGWREKRTKGSHYIGIVSNCQGVITKCGDEILHTWCQNGLRVLFAQPEAC
nr:hypothetical protein Iba_chr06aCG11380 [Ipomoea batatas]